jgi:ABC-type bacteriocin/lantibiotic exporter with double-glycine peptidase domain
MIINANLELLKDNLNKTISKLEKRKDEDKRKTTFMIAFGGLVSGLTTVLIGLSAYVGELATYFSIAALITSASLTIVQAWDNLFHHKKLWIIQTDALGSFKELKEDISHFETNKNLDQVIFNECYERYKQINKTLLSEWKLMRNKD